MPSQTDTAEFTTKGGCEYISKYTSPRGSEPCARIKIDVLNVVHKGTPFLKYGKHGHPHFRHFQISDENTHICWFSKGKEVNKTSVAIADICDLIEGQTTKNFLKHQAPDMKPISLSLIYERKKSLDIIAQDENFYRIWMAAFKALLQISEEKGEEGLRALKELPREVEIIMKCPSSDYLMGLAEELSMDNDVLERDEDDVDDGNEFGKSDKNKLEKKRQKLAKYLHALEKKVRKLTERPEHFELVQEINQLQQEMQQIITHTENGAYGQVRDLLFRTKIDMKAIRDKISVIKHSKVKKGTKVLDHLDEKRTASVQWKSQTRPSRLSTTHF